MLNIELFIIVTLLTIIGSILQASVGFGFGLIVVPFLLAIDTNFVPVPIIFSSLFLMSHVAYKNRFSLSGHSIHYIIIGLLAGAPIGAVILTIIDSKKLIYFVSTVVILGLVASLLNFRVKITPATQFAAATTASILGTSIGIGGVPFALLYQNETGERIRAVLSTAFFVGSIFSLIALSFTSNISSASLLLGCYLIPGIFVGSFIGQKCAVFIDKGYSRIAVILLSSGSVVYLLYGVLISKV
jgi:uncharacterized membrane protein YfcA